MTALEIPEAETWHYGSLRRAYRVAQLSEDPSTQNGAVVLNYAGQVIGTGCNGPTAGVDMAEHWDTEHKYFYTEHAERAALFAAMRSGQQPHTLYAPWSACADCARAVVGLGVSVLVRHKEAMSLGGYRRRNWQESTAAGDEIMWSAGVEIVELSGTFGMNVRRNGTDVRL